MKGLPKGLGQLKLSVRDPIKRDFPDFLLYMASVSTATFSTKEVFEKAVERKEYGEIAKVFEKIYTLAVDWGYGFANACKLVARTIDKKYFKLFLLRLSQTIGVGEPLDVFFKKEYESFMFTFGNEHGRIMERLKNLSEAYSSILTAGSFIMVSMILSSMFFGYASPESVLFTTMFFIALSIMGINMIFYVLTPPERAVHSMRVMPRTLAFLKRSLIPLIISAMMGITILNFLVILEIIETPLNPDLFLSLTFIGGGVLLVIPGFIGKRFLNRVEKLDEQLSPFIRILGGSVSAVGTISSDAIKNILNNDFGPLTPLVHKLYSRLSLGIDSARSWYFFRGESGSELIRRYTEIYVEALSAGGHPEATSNMVDGVVNKLIMLRKNHKQIISYLQGLLVPLNGMLVAAVALVKVLISVLSQYLGRMMKTSAFLSFMNFISPNLLQIYFLINLIIIAFGNALALQFISKEAEFTILYYLGLFLLTGGLAYLLITQLTSNFLTYFTEFGRSLPPV